MILEETGFRLRDGRGAVLRSPCAADAKDLLAYIIRASGETDFLMSYPEEFDGFTLEQEEAFIDANRSSPNQLMILCLVDGRIAGNCRIAFRTGMKDRHRAAVGIAVLREFWRLGIGTRMFEEMFRAAGERGGVRQIELDFIEGNSRARSLYEKMGFRITGVRPDAIRRKDGSFANEYMMQKRL